MSASDSIISKNKAIALAIVEGILSEAFERIEFRAKKMKSVALYHECLMAALKDVWDVYEKPKPCNDQSHVIEAWKRDRSAKPSVPDSLMRDFMKDAM